jgi:hypothetical protein
MHVCAFDQNMSCCWILATCLSDILRLNERETTCQSCWAALDIPCCVETRRITPLKFKPVCRKHRVTLFTP